MKRTRSSFLLFVGAGLIVGMCSIAVVHVLGHALPLFWYGLQGFGGEFELRDVSYEHYRNYMDTPYMDPKGARNIYVKAKFGRDSGYELWRFEISREDYGRLLRLRAAEAENEGQVMEEGNEALRMRTLRGRPLSSSPEWWGPPEAASEHVRYHTFLWNGRMEWWVFDPLETTLWISHEW